jgi:hypothetical protein
MSRESRREKRRAALRVLEAQFLADLVDALRECAAGYGSVFGHNDRALAAFPRLLSTYGRRARQLMAAGTEISTMRAQLGYEPNPLLERYLLYRRTQTPNSLGELKLAAQFLLELEGRVSGSPDIEPSQP